MGLTVAWLVGQLDPLLRPRGTAGEALLLAVSIALGGLLYGLLSLAFRADELHVLWRLIRR
jgi:hypothetical protein